MAEEQPKITSSDGKSESDKKNEELGDALSAMASFLKLSSNHRFELVRLTRITAPNGRAESRHKVKLFIGRHYFRITVAQFEGTCSRSEAEAVRGLRAAFDPDDMAF